MRSYLESMTIAMMPSEFTAKNNVDLQLKVNCYHLQFPSYER